MSKSKLFELIGIFSASQRKDLAFFIQMPSNRLTARDQELIGELLRLQNSRRKIKEEQFISKYLSSKEVGSWNKTKSRCAKVLNRFLLLQSTEKDARWSNYQALSYFAEKKLTKNYNHTLTLGLSKNRTKRLDKLDYLHKFLIHELAVTNRKADRKADDFFAPMVQSLDLFYFENKLRFFCEEANRQSIVNMSSNSKAELLLQQIEGTDSLGIQLYSNIYKMLRGEKAETAFLAVKTLLVNGQVPSISPMYKEAIEYATNYCIRKTLKGELAYANEYLELIKLLMEKQQFLQHGRLNLHHFHNCVDLMLIAEELTWANDFIAEYAPYIDHPYKEVIHRFSEAKVLFYEKKWAACHALLLNFRPFDMYYKINYEKLLFKLYFQQEMDEEIILRIDSFKRYIKSQKKLTEAKKRISLSFARCLWLLVQQRPIEASLIKQLSIIDATWLQKLKKDKRPRSLAL